MEGTDICQYKPSTALSANLCCSCATIAAVPGEHLCFLLSFMIEWIASVTRGQGVGSYLLPLLVLTVVFHFGWNFL